MMLFMGNRAVVGNAHSTIGSATFRFDMVLSTMMLVFTCMLLITAALSGLARTTHPDHRALAFLRHPTLYLI
jgi:hypothetical protein